jgi:recombination protein RecA
MPRKKKDEKKDTTKKAATEKKATKATKKAGVGKLNQMAKNLEKAFKGKDGKVDLDTKAMSKSLPHIPTGSMVIDWLIGGQPNELGVAPCPGLPKGRLFNLYGMESSGKTTLALTTAATTIASGGVVAMIDWEHAIDLRYAQALGVPQDPDKFYLAQPTDLETGIGICYYLAKNGVDLIILDSVGAGVPKKLMEQDIDEIGTGKIGLMSTIWGTFLPRLKEAITKSGTVVIGISQLRDKISTGGFGGGGKHAQGGNSWKFYSDLRIMLRRTGTEKKKTYSALQNKPVERMIGSTIEAKLEKIKVAPNQGAKAEFFIRYGEGIDDVRSILGIAAAHGIVTKNKAHYTWERGGAHAPMKGNGAENFRKAILSTKGAWEQLYQMTLTRMSEACQNGIVEEPDDDEVDLSDLGFET